MFRSDKFSLLLIINKKSHSILQETHNLWFWNIQNKINLLTFNTILWSFSSERNRHNFFLYCNKIFIYKFNNNGDINIKLNQLLNLPFTRIEAKHRYSKRISHKDLRHTLSYFCSDLLAGLYLYLYVCNRINSGSLRCWSSWPRRVGKLLAVDRYGDTLLPSVDLFMTWPNGEPGLDTVSSSLEPYAFQPLSSPINPSSYILWSSAWLRTIPVVLWEISSTSSSCDCWKMHLWAADSTKAHSKYCFISLQRNVHTSGLWSATMSSSLYAFTKYRCAPESYLFHLSIFLRIHFLSRIPAFTEWKSNSIARIRWYQIWSLEIWISGISKFIHHFN